MSRTQDLRNSEGRRPSMGMTYAELGERRDSINKEAIAAAELYGGNDRYSFCHYVCYFGRTGMTYTELGEWRDSVNQEAIAAAELYGGNDRYMMLLLHHLLTWAHRHDICRIWRAGAMV